MRRTPGRWHARTSGRYHGRLVEATAPHSQGNPTPGRGNTSSFKAIIGDVRWTPAFVGLLVYLFAILTYRLPVGEIGMIIALAGVFFQRERLRFPPVLLWFGAYIGWAVVGYFSSNYQPIVLEQLISVFKLWLVAFVIVNALRTRGQIRFFMIFFLLLFATHPARGAIFNYFLYSYQTFGRALWNYAFENPNDLAALTLFPLALAAALLKDRSKWVHRGALASVVVLPIVILMTQSRGVFLALGLFGALTLLGQRKKLKTTVALVVVAGAVVLLAPGGIWGRMSTLLEEGTEADSSAQQRWVIWQIASDVIDDHPITGVGLGAYSQAHEQYARTKTEYYMIAPGERDTHSTYLNELAELGYPGLLLFVVVVAAPLISAERVRRRLKRSSPRDAATLWYLEASLIAYMAAGVFASYGGLSFLYIHLALISVAAGHFQRENRPARRPLRARRQVRMQPAHP